MRHVPPVVFIPKTAAEDTTLTVTNSQGHKVVVPIPKGTLMGIDTAGLHHNPEYWEDPHAFKPDRFLGEYNHDAFLPFSAGPRSCIGRRSVCGLNSTGDGGSRVLTTSHCLRRFFESEGIAALTLFLMRYKISVKEEPRFTHETFEERKARVLAAKGGITIT